MTDTQTKNQIHCEIKSVDKASRTVTAHISVDSVDRDGEVLLPMGCDHANFMRAPTVFYNHDYDEPVGKCIKIRTMSKVVEATTYFATKPDGHTDEWLPDVLLHLFDQGVIYGFSVGFSVHERRDPTPADIRKYGASCKRIFSKWELLEYSVAPLPANQDALVLAMSKSLGCSPEHIKLLLPSPPEVHAPETHHADPDNDVLAKHLQTINEHVLKAVQTAISKALDPEVGGMLQTLIEDVVDTVEQRRQISKGFDDVSTPGSSKGIHCQHHHSGDAGPQDDEINALAKALHDVGAV